MDRIDSDIVSGGDMQIVALSLGSETYGIDIARIHTVITPQAITAVPRSAAFVRGVINLRGRVIPVVDLRIRFDMPPRDPECEHDARIVIVEVDGFTAGLVVDGVSEVLRLPTAAVEAPSELVASSESRCICGIGRMESGTTGSGPAHREGERGAAADRLILLLDVSRIFDHSALVSADVDAVRQAA